MMTTRFDEQYSTNHNCGGSPQLHSACKSIVGHPEYDTPRLRGARQFVTELSNGCAYCFAEASTTSPLSTALRTCLTMWSATIACASAVGWMAPLCSPAQTGCRMSNSDRPSRWVLAARKASLGVRNSRQCRAYGNVAAGE